MGVNLQTGSRHSGQYENLNYHRASRSTGTESPRASQVQGTQGPHEGLIAGFFKKVGDAGKRAVDLLLQDTLHSTETISRKDSFGDRPYAVKVVNYNRALMEGRISQCRPTDTVLVSFLDSVCTLGNAAV